MTVLTLRAKRHLTHFCLDVHVQCRYAVTAVYGPSGAGKTSLLNMVAGLMRPDEGEIALGDEVLFSSAKGIDLPPERRRIGYVFQDELLFPHLSVEENLRYGRDLLPPQERRFDLEQIVDLLEVGPLLARRPAKLSGGERQRVALARSLINQPAVLLADEPTGNLDAEAGQQILSVLRSLNENGQTIVMVTHDPHVAAGAQRRARLEAGRLVQAT